jgi:gliding motility-associated protein GldM
MSIPKEPRQMMINMMYLVLTALLALNVSAEILNAFKVVNDGIERTIVSMDKKNAAIYDAFEKKVEIDSAAKPFQVKALKAKVLSESLIAEIDKLYDDLMEESGAIKNEETGKKELKTDRDTETPTLLMVNRKRGYDLQDKINEARDNFLELYGDARGNKEASCPLRAFDDDIPKEGGGIRKDWVIYNFSDVPVIAAMTILSKLKNDVKSTESDVIEYLSSQIGADAFKFDVLKARAIPKKSYLNLGDRYEADIFVSASSSTVDPIVYYGNFDSKYIKKQEDGNWPAEIEADEVPLLPGYTKGEDPVGGVVKYETSPNRQGTITYRGVVAVKNTNTGKTKYYPFENEYTVAKSQAVVSADKMNVLYIGVDNPVSISVPGFQANQIRPSITSGYGSLTPTSGGGYMAKVTKTGEAKINVSVVSDGSTKNVGGKKFRIKRIPNPTAYVGNSPGPVIKNGELKASRGLYAKADNFEFDVNFTIKSFEITYKKARSNNLTILQNKGPLWTGDIKNLIKQVKPGDRLWIDNIRIAAPDGTTRTANISFKIL